MSAGFHFPQRTTSESLCAFIGAKTRVPASMVIPFTNANDALVALMQMASPTTNRLVVAGHATPDLALCADRAEMTLCEIIDESPFSADPRAVLAALGPSGDSAYIANPNRITGTTYSATDLDQIASALGDGLLVIDEYYYDLCGITAAALLEKYPNIVVIR